MKRWFINLLSYFKWSAVLQATSVRDGDVVLLNGAYVTPDCAEGIKRAFQERGLGNCLLFHGGGAELRVLNEAEARAAGWQRLSE